MKKPKRTLDERARIWATYIVTMLLGKLHGEQEWRDWLWELTPFPAGIPRWSECAQGLFAAFLPPPFYLLFMRGQFKTSYEQMDRAHERFKRDYAKEEEKS